MKLDMCFLLLISFAALVATDPTPAARQNESSILNDSLSTTTKKSIPAETTATNSFTDVSEVTSAETYHIGPFPEPEVLEKNGGESRDLDSHEIVTPEALTQDKFPSRRTVNADDDLMSREFGGPQRKHQASPEQNDPNSEDEETRLKAQEAENLSGGLSQSTEIQRKETPGRVRGMTRALVSGPSRERLDLYSLDNNGRLATVGNIKITDYDETREFVSSETLPFVPPERRPSSSPVPAKI